MARLVLISPYLKGGKQAPRLANLTRYLATRPGVEKLEDRRDRPATEEQKSSIRRLLRAFPAAGELLEYEDYRENPTWGNADAFLQQAREEFLEESLLKKYGVFDPAYVKELKALYTQSDFQLMGAYEIDYLLIVMTVTMLCEDYGLTL